MPTIINIPSEERKKFKDTILQLHYNYYYYTIKTTHLLLLLHDVYNILIYIWCHLLLSFEKQNKLVFLMSIPIIWFKFLFKESNLPREEDEKKSDVLPLF